MSPLLTIDTTQTGGPGHSTRPKTSPQGEFTCSKISPAMKLASCHLSWNHSGQPGKSFFSQNTHQSITELDKRRLLIAIYEFEISIAGTIWNSFVGRSLSLILVRRKVTALEWITVHAGWWGEVEPGVKTIDFFNSRDYFLEDKVMTHCSCVQCSWLLLATATDPRSRIKTSHWLGVLAADIETHTGLSAGT